MKCSNTECGLEGGRGRTGLCDGCFMASAVGSALARPLPVPPSTWLPPNAAPAEPVCACWSGGEYLGYQPGCPIHEAGPYAKPTSPLEQRLAHLEDESPELGPDDAKPWRSR